MGQQQLREARETIAKLETQVGREKSDERVKAENNDDDEKIDVKKECFDSPSRRGENIEREKEESRQATPVKSEEEENEGSTRQGRRGDRGRTDSPGGKRGRGRGRGRNASRSDADDEEGGGGGREREVEEIEVGQRKARRTKVKVKITQIFE